MKTRFSLLLSSLVLMGGCTIGPDYVKPSSTIPDAFHNAQGLAKPGTIDKNWWESFHDPILTQLVTKALESNYDLPFQTHS